MNSPVSSRLLFKPLASWSRQIKRETCFTQCGMISRGVCDCAHHCTHLALRDALSLLRKRSSTFDFAKSPESHRLGIKNSLRIRMKFVGSWSAWLTSNFLQQGRQSLHDLRLCRLLETSRSSCPGCVPTEFVLFRWRNVSLGAIREFDVHRHCHWTAILQLDAGDAKDFVRHRSNTQITNTNSLQL